MTTTNGNAAAVDPTIETQRNAFERGESLLVALAIAQGTVLGVWLALFPAMALRLGGFPPAAAFFVRWAGVLHLVLAVGYFLEWARFRRTTLLVLAKASTAVFIAAAWVADGLPWLMIVAVGVEAAMAAAGVLLHGPATRSRRANARLRLVRPAPTRIRPAGRS